MSRSSEERRKDYVRNREKELEQQKIYYQNNKDKCLDYQRKYRKENRSLVTLKVRMKRLARKEEAIQKLGGKCQKCNLSFPSPVYDFHHVDRTTKDILVSQVLTLGETRFWEEVNKCILLCANCHRLEHMNDKE